MMRATALVSSAIFAVGLSACAPATEPTPELVVDRLRLAFDARRRFAFEAPGAVVARLLAILAEVTAEGVPAAVVERGEVEHLLEALQLARLELEALAVERLGQGFEVVGGSQAAVVVAHVLGLELEQLLLGEPA